MTQVVVPKGKTVTLHQRLVRQHPTEVIVTNSSDKDLVFEQDEDVCGTHPSITINVVGNKT